MARPEGQRCIVESSEGRTTSRARNGALIHRFKSPLPNGSSATGASQVGTWTYQVLSHSLHLYSCMQPMAAEVHQQLRPEDPSSCCWSCQPHLPATPVRLSPGCLQSPTLLDCIFHEPANTYYVVDVLSWNGCDLSDCTLECRLAFWVHSKLAELPQLSGQEPSLAALPFAPVSSGELLPA